MSEENFTPLEHSTTKRICVPGSQHRRCPHCEAPDPIVKESARTLIGGGDGTEDGDPNHVTQTCVCRACKRSFERHTKSGNVWYADPASRIVLAGAASCFETFHYPCTCGGMIRRHYTKLDGVTPAATLTITTEHKLYRTFWSCDRCAWNCETPDDHA